VKPVLKRSYFIGVIMCLTCARGEPQEVPSGISVPLTISGDVAYGHNLSPDDGQSSVTPGFRALISPTVQLGPHWFLYSNIEARTSYYFSYETGADEKPPVQFSAIQAFLGYTNRIGNASFLFKAGQLSSAFGYFPLQYDDAKTAFPDPPPGYVTNLPLRPDQLPCGVSDLLWQTYGSEVQFYCGGANTSAYGMFPVSLYGLPSFQAELSSQRFDARLQITNSSPANPQGLTSDSQSVQWAAGGGYTVPGGLHVGLSGFRGPYLDRVLDSVLPRGRTFRDFPATGLGVDAQWARGRWSLEGEWQHFRFTLPGFVTFPSESLGYAQAKATISPRIFVAGRATVINFGRVEDTSGVMAMHSAAPQRAYELALGYRLNLHQLIKTGYEWIERNDSAINAGPNQHGSLLTIQLVTTLNALSRAFD